MTDLMEFNEYVFHPCREDHLEIYGYVFAEQVGCIKANSNLKQFVSDNNNLTLRFVSDKRDHTTGFQLSFTETWEGKHLKSIF